MICNHLFLEKSKFVNKADEDQSEEFTVEIYSY